MVGINKWKNLLLFFLIGGATVGGCKKQEYEEVKKEVPVEVTVGTNVPMEYASKFIPPEDSLGLSPEATDSLSKVAKGVKDLLAKGYKIKEIDVVGYASAEGDSLRNKALSVRRAKLIFKELLEKGVEIDTVYFHVEGGGERDGERLARFLSRVFAIPKEKIMKSEGLQDSLVRAIRDPKSPYHDKVKELEELLGPDRIVKVVVTLEGKKIEIVKVPKTNIPKERKETPKKREGPRFRWPKWEFKWPKLSWPKWPFSFKFHWPWDIHWKFKWPKWHFHLPEFKIRIPKFEGPSCSVSGGPSCSAPKINGPKCSGGPGCGKSSIVCYDTREYAIFEVPIKTEEETVKVYMVVRWEDVPAVMEALKKEAEEEKKDSLCSIKHKDDNYEGIRKKAGVRQNNLQPPYNQRPKNPPILKKPLIRAGRWR